MTSSASGASGRYPWIDEPVEKVEEHPKEFEMASFKKSAEEIAKNHKYTSQEPKDRPIVEEVDEETEDDVIPIYIITLCKSLFVILLRRCAC